MDLPWWYWLVGFSILWIAHLGIWWTLTPILIFGSFGFGCVSYLYSKTANSLETFERTILSDGSIKPGLRKILDEVSRKKEPIKIDKRLTGSHVIDENLHEIISLILKDFITPWYTKLSADDNFEFAVQKGIQDIIVNISSRMKEVGWIHYLTTRLVDDAASHLRLYRQACERTKVDPEVKKSAPQTLASFKSATQQNFPGGHSRNNSDGGVKTTPPKSHSRNSSLGEKPMDLESAFFQLEAECENSRLCHNQVCSNKDSEQRYLDEVLDIIMFLVLPSEDFQCLPARTLLREIIINAVVVPLFDKLSDSDFINMCLIWLCRDVGLTSDSFLAALRATDNRDELISILDIVKREIAVLRGRDSGGEGDALVRQHLSSLMYVQKSIDAKLQGDLSRDRTANPSGKLVILPLSAILKNNIALSYFIDYLATVDMQNYIFLFLNIESWRESVRTELQRPEQSRKKISDTLRDDAFSIYQQYLSDALPKKVRLDAAVEERLQVRLREPFTENLFDEVVSALQTRLNEKTLPEFYKSSVYLKLLTELELLKDGDPEDDSQSPDSVSLADSYEEEYVQRPGEPRSGVGKFQITVEIVDCGVVQDRGKTYGVYALSVVKTFENGFTERWHVYRRYSDFHDFQQKVKDSYSDLGKLPFPGKKTFNNMEATTLAKRMKMLNDYLQILLHSGVAETHHKLPGLLLSFLEPGEYDKSVSLGSAIESVVSPIKSSMRTVSAVVRTMPDNLLSTVDGISRTLQTGRKDPSRVAAEILNRNEENVPLRIMLLLMDEVFDLHSRNQWLRRRIVTLLRQMFGDIVNRKILDFVEELTGPARVAGYLATLKEALWPGGVRAEPHPDRDEGTRLRTRVVAKTALLSSLSDDLKHILGSETTRRGLLRVYNTFQHSRINRRLLYVLLEGVLELIFPPIITIHSKMSSRPRR